MWYTVPTNKNRESERSKIMNKREELIGGIKKTAHTSFVLSMITAVIMLAGGIGLMAYTVVSKTGMQQSGRITITSEESQDTKDDDKESRVKKTTERATAAVGIIMNGIVMLVVGLMLKKISESGTPFIPLSKSFNISAALVAAESTVPSWLGSLITVIKFGSLKQGVKMTVNLQFVFFALILFLLGRIFSYGTLLQQEADDTI